MEGRLICGATPALCWTAFQDHIWGYWGRLASAGSGRGVIAGAPTLRFDSSTLTFQFGFCEDLRLISQNGRSLLSFVDTALRSFAVEAWSEMYPSIYLHLSEPTGHFSFLTQQSSGHDIEISESNASHLRAILRQGRADGIDWYQEVEQWRNDVDARSECAPELFQAAERGSTPWMQALDVTP